MIISHERSPQVERTVQIAGSPGLASPGSWLDNVVLPRRERDRGRWIVVEVNAGHRLFEANVFFDDLGDLHNRSPKSKLATSRRPGKSTLA